MPIKVTNASCLTCHSTPDKAPPEMIKAYGSANGFGWKLDEVIGAQIVSVPATVPILAANKAFREIGLWLAGIFGVVLLLVNGLVLLFSNRPAPVVPGTVTGAPMGQSRMS